MPKARLLLFVYSPQAKSTGRYEANQYMKEDYRLMTLIFRLFWFLTWKGRGDWRRSKCVGSMVFVIRSYQYSIGITNFSFYSTVTLPFTFCFLIVECTQLIWFILHLMWSRIGNCLLFQPEMLKDIASFIAKDCKRLFLLSWKNYDTQRSIFIFR